MAVTSLWRVKGYVGGLILYVMNEKKTTQQEVIKTGHDGTDCSSALGDLIAYTERDSATNLKQFVYGIRCHQDTCREDMMAVKNHFKKTDGIVAYHGYQSFAGNEVSPKQAHEIGIKLAKELWGDRYQVLVTTHLDKDSHIHNHFVINTVSWVDGKKFHRTKKDYLQMREVSDRLCREYGLSVIENPKGHGKNYAEWRAEKNGEYTKNGIIRRDIDECIAVAMNEKQFYREMMSRGYTFNFDRKYATIFHPNFPKARRMKTLGEEYTPEAIRERLHGRWQPRKFVFPEQDDPEKLFFDGDRNNRDVFKDWQTVYVHFVYGITVVRERPDENRELMRLLGDEIIKFDKLIEQQNLLVENNLHTDDEVKDYVSKSERELQNLSEARRILRNELKKAVRADDSGEQERLKRQIGLLSERMQAVRKDIKVCGRILKHEPQVEKDLHVVKDYTDNLKRKEVKRHEHIGRSGRSGC